VVAQGILAAVDLVRSGRAESGSPVALGLGGPHYAPNITKYALSNHVAVGHIVQGSILEEEDVEKVVKIALEGNGPTDFALLDWKGVKGGTRAKALSVAEGLGLKVIKARAALPSLGSFEKRSIKRSESRAFRCRDKWFRSAPLP